MMSKGTMVAATYQERLRCHLGGMPENSDLGNGWTITRESVQRDSAARFLEAIHTPGRSVPNGHYTFLKDRGSVVMSDTPNEMRDHRMFTAECGASERVLITGLGIGCAAAAALSWPGVQHVQVIEKYPGIAKATGDVLRARFGADRLTIEIGDALDRMPAKGERYDVIWHDIWPNLCVDNLKEMAVLNRRWAKRKRWQGCWGQEILQHFKRKRMRT